MRNYCDVSAAWRPSGPIRAVSIAAFSFSLGLLFTSSSAFAASAQATVASAQTGRSLEDAAGQNENELIDREVHGQASGGAGTGGATLGVFSSGRLRTSDHDGQGARRLVTSPLIVDTDGPRTFAYETDEASVFANVVAGIPGTVLGGQLKISGFVGYNQLSLDLESNELRVLDPNQFGSAENGSVIAGGTALWSLDRTYALASVVGAWGETKLVDSVDDCGNPGCNLHRYRYDTSGFIGTLTAGKVFALTSAPSGPMLDLRGSVGYTQNDGESFKNVFGDSLDVDFSTWNGTVGATVFANMVMGNSAVLRPYVQASFRQEWDYVNEIRFIQAGSGALAVTAYQQDHSYLGLDAGLTYTIEKMTVGGSVYVDGSADDETLGGRLGASWTFN